MLVPTGAMATGRGAAQPITVTRSIPPGSTLLVTTGQSVAPGTALATLEADTGALHRVECALRLGCRPEELREHLTVAAGTRVGEGQPLGFRALFETPIVALSPCGGRVTLISTRLGFVYVREVSPAGGGPVTMDMSRLLGVPPSGCRQWLKVRRGDRVHRGQVVASLPVGATSRLAPAPISGIVQDISPDGSRLTVEPVGDITYSLLAGVVTEARPGRHVKIATHGWRLQGTFGVGGPACGILAVEPDGQAGGESYRPAVQDAVVLLRAAPDRARLGHLQAAGAKAVIAPFMDELELVSYLGQEIRLGITSGTDRSGMAIVLLEGFAPGAASRAGDGPAALEFLAGFEGKPVYVDGRTQVRAGARRPEIIVVPEETRGAGAASGATAALKALRGTEAEGSTKPGMVPGAEAMPEGRDSRGPVAAQPKPAAARPGGRWVYPCFRPRTAGAYSLRFPGCPVPRGEAYPGPATRSAFPGLPVLDGAVAKAFEALAAAVAREAAPVLGQALDSLSEPQAVSFAALSPGLLVGAALLRALREEESRAGLWCRRTPAERTCPGFILTSDSPALVLRAVPAGVGTFFLVPLGRPYGWTPWHLDLLARPEVSKVMRRLEGTKLDHGGGRGFLVLKELGLATSVPAAASGLMSCPVADPESLAGFLDWSWGLANRLAQAMSPYWRELEVTIHNLAPGTIPAVTESPAGSPAETPGFGDFAEAFYACVASAVLVEGQRVGFLPKPRSVKSAAELALMLSP